MALNNRALLCIVLLFSVFVIYLIFFLYFFLFLPSPSHCGGALYNLASLPNVLLTASPRQGTAEEPSQVFLLVVFLASMNFCDGSTSVLHIWSNHFSCLFFYVFFRAVLYTSFLVACSGRSCLVNNSLEKLHFGTCYSASLSIQGYTAIMTTQYSGEVYRFFLKINNKISITLFTSSCSYQWIMRTVYSRVKTETF